MRGTLPHTSTGLTMPSMKPDDWLADTRASYDTVALSYADQARASLAAQPHLQAALALIADMVRVARAATQRTAAARLHAGDGTRLKKQGYGGHPMKVYVHRRQPDQVAAWLRDAGFAIEAVTLLDPDANVPGALIFARRSGAMRS